MMKPNVIKAVLLAAFLLVSIQVPCVSFQRLVTRIKPQAVVRTKKRGENFFVPFLEQKSRPSHKSTFSQRDSKDEVGCACIAWKSVAFASTLSWIGLYRCDKELAKKRRAVNVLQFRASLNGESSLDRAQARELYQEDDECIL